MAFFYDERKNLLVTVMLCNAFSTHVTAFLDTRRVRGGFASVFVVMKTSKDIRSKKKILPTSYLLERIDMWCKG